MTDPGSHWRGYLVDSSPLGPRERKLSEAFVGLIDTLTDDFDLVDVMDLLAEAAIDVLGCAASGVLLAATGDRLAELASSGQRSHLLDAAQLRTQQGPGPDCYHSQRAVHVPDMAMASRRWPAFAEAAVGLGVRSAHAIPLQLRRDTVGCLNLYVDGPQLSAETLDVAALLGVAAAAGILHRRALLAGRVVQDQLETALSSRIVIEQAKGLLAAVGDLDVDEAFTLLRRYVRANNLRLSATALLLVSRRLDPAAVLRP